MRYALQRYLQVCKAQRIRLRGSSYTSAWAQASHRSSWAHCKCIQWQPGTFQAFHSVKTGTGRACQPARGVCCPLHVATCPAGGHVEHCCRIFASTIVAKSDACISASAPDLACRQMPTCSLCTPPTPASLQGSADTCAGARCHYHISSSQIYQQHSTDFRAYH